MIGIRDYGSYIPAMRLARAEIIRAWQQKALAQVMVGERAVANYDEDSLTMAAEAALDCLAVTDPATVDGLYFASTTAPYREKLSASLIATVAHLGPNAVTADFGNSLRAGTGALRAALDAARAGRQVVVTAADTRVVEPGHHMEHVMGAGAAALLVGEGEEDDVLCAIEESFAFTHEFTDTWRRAGDEFLRFGDEGFSARYGYFHCVQAAIQGILQKATLSPDEITTIVCYAPEARSFTALAKRSGLDNLYTDPMLLMNVGNTGASFPLLMLAAVLDQAAPGDRILWVSYGDGSDAFLLRVTEALARRRDQEARRTVAGWVASKRTLPNYESYLKVSDLVKSRAGLWGFSPFTSIPMLWRETAQNLQLMARRCNQCGRVIYPVRRVCPQCRAKDDATPCQLRRRGTVASFTVDHVFPSPIPPTTLVVVDLDSPRSAADQGGGRILTPLTDCDPGEAEIGMPVELTLRKFHEGRGFNNYYWKARPVRGVERKT